MSGAVELRDWLEERLEPERAVIARLWALAPELAASPRNLVAAMLQPDQVRAAVARLGVRERAALEFVQAHAGTVNAPVLEREYGRVRDASNYANPRAYLLALAAPPEPTERLYLLGFVQLMSNGNNRTYAIPPDLLAALPSAAPAQTSLGIQPTGAPANAGNTANPIEQDVLGLITLADDAALEVIPGGGLNKASLLRLARFWTPGEKLTGASREEHIPYFRFLRTVAEAAGFVRSGADAQLRPTRAAIEWMRQEPTERSQHLLDAWITSTFDELVSFNLFTFSRAYGRDISRAKRAIVRLLAQLTPDAWYAFADFVAAVKRVEPDFARPNGLYDTWGIRNHFGMSLDGFQHWEAVEGEQIRGFIGALGWLGLTEIGVADEKPVSFRLRPLGATLIHGTAEDAATPPEPLIIQPDFAVLVPPHAALYAQFEMSRIAARGPSAEVINYTLTKRALQAALERGSTIEQIEQFLHDASGRPLPQNVAATLREWAGQHGRVAMRRAVLLETSDNVLMQQLQHDKRLRFPQAEPLTDTVCTLREGDAAQLADRMRKAGYGLIGDDFQPDIALSERDLTVVMAALEFYAGACHELDIEGDASAALLRRVAKLLPEKQLNRAYQVSAAALVALRQSRGKRAINGA